MTSPSDITHPTLVIVRGLPGSGKTYLAAELQKNLASRDVIALDPDKTDYQSQAYVDHVKKLTEDGVDPKLFAYRFLRAQAYKGIEQHKTIIWNQPFTNLEIFHKMISGLRNYAQEHGTQLEVLVVEVNVDPVVAKRRVDERKASGGHGPSNATFERFVSDYKSFAPEGYQVVAVDGQRNVTESVAAVVRALNLS